MIFKKLNENVEPNITPRVHDKWKENEAWEANEGRHERIDKYRKLVLLDEDTEITEDNLQDWAVKRICVDSGWPKERVTAELLGQKYSDLEED